MSGYGGYEDENGVALPREVEPACDEAQHLPELPPGTKARTRKKLIFTPERRGVALSCMKAVCEYNPYGAKHKEKTAPDVAEGDGGRRRRVRSGLLPHCADV